MRSKLDPHDAFILRLVEGAPDIKLSKIEDRLAAGRGVQAAPLTVWLFIEGERVAASVAGGRSPWPLEDNHLHCLRLPGMAAPTPLDDPMNGPAFLPMPSRFSCQSYAPRRFDHGQPSGLQDQPAREAIEEVGRDSCSSRHRVRQWRFACRQQKCRILSPV
ncbi:hypothetical protein FHS85_004011 [Rhodoligotrophos appendicifer]|uniref:hypothetical protein n=1 Tax=Rhodoligotrophos appendicifer TaxID=987056 RepID=UPI0011870C35|nr:hypothetical protein [Rhodoligotrophos appendicifer]